MSKLINFLNEKVNKKELNDIFKSNNILVGAEFEFLVDEQYIRNQMELNRPDYSDSIEYDDKMNIYREEYENWSFDRNNYMQDIRNDKSVELIEKMMIEWDDENPEPMGPEMPIDYVDTWSREDIDEVEFSIVENIVRDYMYNKPKLNKYIISSWDIVEDSSLSSNGVELVTSPMELNDFFIACKDVFEMINDIGYTDNDCGLHIGVSLKYGMDEVDPVKLMLFTDEEQIYKYFDNRTDNQFVRSVKEVLRKEIIEINNISKYRKLYNSTKIVKELIKGKINVSDISSHYNGVNTSHLDEENQYIEFRYMGGSGYHNKFDTIKKIVGIYIYNLKLSRDKEFKKDEYISKCNRILLKIETVTLMIELDRLEDMLTWQSGLMITEIEGKIKKIKKLLINYPKITKMEFKTYANLLGSYKI